MSYLRTVVTYHQPSEAEVDKAFLESHGIAVCLLNANTSRNELGAPFYIQLQVPEIDYDRAVAVLKEANPQRFGSAERVAEIEKSIKRALLRFILPALIFGIVIFFFVPAPIHLYELDLRPRAAVLGGIIAGMLSVFLIKKKKDEKA
jgi:hypothetical protein